MIDAITRNLNMDNMVFRYTVYATAAYGAYVLAMNFMFNRGEQ